MADVQHVALTGADLHEPKGVAAANDNEIYTADGAGGGAWINHVAYAEVKLDLTGTLTRSFAGATAYTDFILDYIAEHTSLFTYNDTTKELTYTGIEDFVFTYSFTMSIARTDVGGTPEMTIAMFEDIGAGFVEITSSRSARSFAGTAVGSMAITGLHTMVTGNKLKMQVKTDAGIDIDIRNINWTLNAVKRTA